MSTALATFSHMKNVAVGRYNREEVVASLGREINLNPPLTLGQLPDTSEELLKLDQVAQPAHLPPPPRLTAVYT